MPIIQEMGRIINSLVSSLAITYSTHITMPDLPDPNSPYLILQQNDVTDHNDRALVRMGTDNIKSGNPIIIPWKPASYGQPTDVPAAMLESSEVNLVFLMLSFHKGAKTDIKVGPGAIVSKALYENLNTLVPDACETLDAVLLGPDGSKLEYKAIFPKKQLKSKKLDEAKKNDLQWGAMAFDEKDAPGELFALTLGRQTHIIISKRVAENITLDTYLDVGLSKFHRTPAAGGARPATAAFTRMLNKKDKSGDADVVKQALSDGENGK
jgi:hypothetical protein